MDYLLTTYNIIVLIWHDIMKKKLASSACFNTIYW